MLRQGMRRARGTQSTPPQYRGCEKLGRAGLRELGVWAEVGALLGHAKGVRCAGTTLTC